MQISHQLILILDNVRSAHNVGSLLRTADAAGVGKIYLCGYTPDPIDRFGRARADIAKVALGAEKTVPWEHANDTAALIDTLKNEGVFCIALEQSPKAFDYTKVKPRFPAALIVGPEVEGLDQDILDRCDSIAEIPMSGAKESLNVSVAAGIMLFALRDFLKQ